MTPDDADGLLHLYDQLSADDRHRRFFSGFRPDRAFVDREARVVEHGGFGLVAELSPGTDDARIVGAAGYVPLPDGDGELAITIARGWRGWLGPFLLDVVLGAAASSGIRNLQADVLFLNRQMLAMARSRGFVTMAHPDTSVVRIAIGTRGMPRWPESDVRPRVLVEVPGGHWVAEDAAREAGLQVLACSGPGGASAGGRWGCPVQRGLPCPLATDADVVVVCHPADDPAWTAVRSAHEHLHAVPVVEGAAGIDEVARAANRSAARSQRMGEERPNDPGPPEARGRTIQA